MKAAAGLLVWLAGREDRMARQSYSAAERELRRRVSAEFPPIDRHTLAELVDHRRGESVTVGDDNSRYIFGPISRIGGEWLPVMSVTWDFGATPAVLRLRAAMFVVGGTKLRASGNRFETPEGPGGLHNFYHAQPINAFGTSGKALPGPPPVNMSQPAMPLDASSPVSLLLAAIVALYDVALVREALLHVQLARRYVGELRCLN